MMECRAWMARLEKDVLAIARNGLLAVARIDIGRC